MLMWVSRTEKGAQRMVVREVEQMRILWEEHGARVAVEGEGLLGVAYGVGKDGVEVREVVVKVEKRVLGR